MPTPKPKATPKPKTRRPARKSSRRMDRDEMRTILEELARTGGDSAKVAAIKALLSMGVDEPATTKNDPFAELDGQDELARRRQAA
jgi:hypothetical protein